MLRVAATVSALASPLACGKAIECPTEVVLMQSPEAGTAEGPQQTPVPADDLVPGLRRPASARRPRPHLRRYLLLGGALLGVGLLGTGLAFYLLARSDLNSFRTIKDPFASIPAAQRPPVPPGALSQDVTFLVGGVDTRSTVPTTGKQAQSGARGRTDTLMMVHLLAGGRGAYVVSIPRDSWVPIPGHGMGKVNWAYFFGGQTLAVRTIEQLTGVRVDHVAVIDWAGFRALTNALGGVTVDIPVTSYDPDNQVTWTKGIHHLDGTQALLYVRDRYGLTNGDFGREARQQNFLRAVFSKLHDSVSLTTPLRLAALAGDLSQAVSVDDTLTDADIEHLLLDMRSLKNGNIEFATVPYVSTGQVGGQSVVDLNPALDQGFWHAFEYDTLPVFMQEEGLKPLGATTP
jgi:LCP family protein required for cell wall assembly